MPVPGSKAEKLPQAIQNDGSVANETNSQNTVKTMRSRLC
jgi:hypothetical protein